MVLADVGMGDWLLCEVTTVDKNRPGTVRVTSQDMQSGTLQHDSWARVNRIYTVNNSLIRYTYGRLTDAKREEILQAVRNLF